MKAAALVASLLTSLAFARPAAAQFRPVQDPPKTWVSVSAGGFMNPGRVADPQSGTWDFGSALSVGLGLHRQVGSSLMLGIDGSIAPSTAYEISADGAKIDEGNGRLMTGMLTGRLQTGGTDTFGMYLMGGAGAFVYQVPSLDRLDPDLALKTGGGLEYRPSNNHALFVEWGRFWTFHQKDGVKDNSSRHSQISIGGRLGL